MDPVRNNLPNDTSSQDSFFRILLSNLKRSPPSFEQIKLECERVRKNVQFQDFNFSSPDFKDVIKFLGMNKNDKLIDEVFLIFGILAEKLNNPWHLLEQLLSSGNKGLILKALDLLSGLRSKELLVLNYDIKSYFIDKQASGNLIINSEEVLIKLADVFRENSASGSDILLDMYLNDTEIRNRFFAARLLDSSGIPADVATIEYLTGTEHLNLLNPFFAYTRISYTDLLYLLYYPDKPPLVIESIKNCVSVCGEDLTRKVIAEAGWKNVNYGISVKHYLGISFKGSLPLFASESEARLFVNSAGAEIVSGYFLFTAHGGLPAETSKSNDHSEPIALFRSYNLAHANLLNDILDVAPLSRKKIKSLIGQLDNIVKDFVVLFHQYTEECTLIPDVYNKLKKRILDDLSLNSAADQISADTTRLVQMFEDPRNIMEVHTLHGLKRYLHQKGLQLGFKLVGQSRSANRSITLILASETKVLSVIKKINYADFEPKAQHNILNDHIPYSVKAAADGIERQMLQGQVNFPNLNIFCYGNEVHYFVLFRNHPVFIRVDFSPPLRGGMVDLQYYGVSNYEIADHPNIYLDSIKYFFEYLEFNVKLEGTHIHARYDKERALDLSQLCERVEYLFCLVPYLMDLDWVIGSLNLDAEAKKKVTKAWAEFFKLWGVLPFDKILTKDKLDILERVETSAEGQYDVIWNGEEDYKDRYTIRIPSGFIDDLFRSVEKLGLDIPEFFMSSFSQMGQIFLENKLLRYLRKGLSDGEIIATVKGYQRVNEEEFQRVHEAVLFAELLNRRDDDYSSAVVLGKMIMPLEQILKFRITGTLDRFMVESSILPLRGEYLRLYILRDPNGIIRMGLYTRGNLLSKRRHSPEDPWMYNALLSALEFQSLLRENHYTVPGSELSVQFQKDDIKFIPDEFPSSSETVIQDPFSSDRVISGLRASPGRAAGRLLLGIEGRLPEDFDGKILAAASISPDENTYLYHSAGILATGGGILSHAGLIATQFNKPALIISGEWMRDSAGVKYLTYKASEFNIKHQKVNGFNVRTYTDVKEKEYQMRDGDLAVLDADKSSLQVFGQDRDTIGLFEGLKSLGLLNEMISQINDEGELLILRGKKLHIRHQVEKILQRMTDPSLAGYALQEIVVGKLLANDRSTQEERTQLLNYVLQNEKVCETAGNHLLQISNDYEIKFIDAYRNAINIIPDARFLSEIVMVRLNVLRIYDMIRAMSKLIPGIVKETEIFSKYLNDIDKKCISRLENIYKNLSEMIEEIYHIKNKGVLRHLIRHQTRVNSVMNNIQNENHYVKIMQKFILIDDELSRRKFLNNFIIKPFDGGFELAEIIGWKAANLAETSILGNKYLVPPWFVITDRAFQKVLEASMDNNVFISGEKIFKGTSLYNAIEQILTRTDLSNKDKSLHIRNLWNLISIPEEIKESISEAYNEIRDEYFNNRDASEFFIALRSSSCEEDAETNARAGEFETYLFITGEESLLQHTRKTWSGLWTERAIHNRSVLGNQKVRIRGGIIVQQMIWSRVSGVLQTINAAKGDLKEIVINAGLGLGEGIVSGIVGADHITVSKKGNLDKDPLHFNYITADKSSQVIFNKKSGYGTVLAPTLYHQRFRPALEYVELCELVSVASRLEVIYGYPIDIEFGIEGTKLWILQVRPVPTFLPALEETINKYPLTSRMNSTLEELK
jgi:hypothetical protein